MTLYDSAAAFTRRYPVHPDSQPSEGWDMNCALLMARFALAPGGVGWAVAPRAYGDAITVANNSGLLNRNTGAAPVGAWHFWNWGIYGHVGVDLTGGGGNVFMASSFLRESWGVHIGINSVAGYNAANRTATYLGWSTNYRGGQYNLTGLASTGSRPLGGTSAPGGSNLEGNEMITRELVRQTGTADVYYSLNREVRYHVADESMLADYKAHLQGLAQAGDPYLSGPGQLYWQQDPPEVARIESFGAIVGAVPTVDVKALSAALTNAVASAIAASGPGASPDSIAKAVVALLASNFAAIPAAVVRAQGAALSNG